MVSASRRFLAAALRLGLSAGMKMLGNELVDLVLGEVERFHLASYRLQSVAVRIGQCPKVGRVHLGVAAEAAEILIHHCGVQECIETDC